MSKRNTSNTQNIGDVPKTDDLRKTIDLSKQLADISPEAEGHGEDAKAGQAEAANESKGTEAAETADGAAGETAEAADKSEAEAADKAEAEEGAGEAGAAEDAETTEDAEAPDKAETAEGTEGESERAPYRDADEADDTDEAGEDDEQSGVLDEIEEDDRPYSLHLRKRRKHRKRHWIRYILILMALIAAFILVGNLSYFKITEIAVIGNRTVSDKSIRKHSGIKKGDSIFFVNPVKAKMGIKENKFIEKVNIDRHLPGSVEIIVTEREAAAQFVRHGKNGKLTYVLTDKEGMVLKSAKNQQDVTMIINVRVTGATVGEQIKVKETGTYRLAMELIDTAEKGDLYFKRINIKGSMVQAHIFDHLSCRGRYDNLVASIQNGELKSVVYKLYQEGNERGTINIGDNNYCSFTPQK